MFEIAVLIVSVLVNSVLGLAVIVKNPDKDLNRLFFGLTLSLSLWSVITYFSVNPEGFSQIVWVRLVLAFASILSYFVLTSFAVFPQDEFKSLRFRYYALIYLLFVIALTQTPFVFKGLNYDASGGAQPIVAPGIGAFMLLVGSFLGGAVFMLFRKFRHSKGQNRDQLRIVLFGVATSFAGIVFSNLVLVSFFKNTSLISYAPLLTLILTGSMAYAILKHRLFDIRAAVARAMAYVLSFTLVVLIYIGLAFVLGALFSLGANDISASQRFFFVSLAVVTALAFQPVKKFFDRTTNRIFYKDAYEPQTLFDQLSAVLVSNYLLEQMMLQSAKTITDNIKLVGCDFILGNQKSGYRVIGNFSQHAQKELPEEVIKGLEKHKHEVLIIDDIKQSESWLKEALASRDYAAIFPMTTNSANVGYLAAGNRKSGDVFNALDRRVLRTLADELALAAENALRFEQIEQFNATLQQKVNDATRELRVTNEKLKALDETKDEFISMASHQLRTPLTSVKGYISMVLEGDAGKVNDMQRKLLDQSFLSSQRMVNLIADLLNVSRLRTGKFVIESKPTNLADLVEGEVSQLVETAKQRNLTLTYEKPKNFPTLMLDETKIRQVVMNFADNAIYYTPAGGHIAIGVVEKDDSVEFTVTDDGIGVPKAEQHHLFNKFYRAGNARKARPDGTGLGLFMAKKVVVAQGGAIIFKTQEGKGSTFGFTFAKSKLKVPEADKEPAKK
jgi:signal transduction histidine kinase